MANTSEPSFPWIEFRDDVLKVRRTRTFFISETHHHRLRRQLDAEFAQDLLLYLVFQQDDVRGLGAAAVHDRERVLGRDPHRSARQSLVKTRVLDQPCRRELYQV